MSISDKPQIAGYRHGRVPREIRERQMLDVAEATFAELGFDGTSIEEVCRRSGLKRPLFYTYFGGKDGLYLACYRRAREELDASILAAAKAVDGDGPDAFRLTVEAMFGAYLAFLDRSPSRWDMLYGPGSATTGPIAEEVASQRFRTVELLFGVGRRYVRPAVDDDTVRAYANVVSGSAEQLARWWRRDPALTLEQLGTIGAQASWASLAVLQDPTG